MHPAYRQTTVIMSIKLLKVKRQEKSEEVKQQQQVTQSDDQPAESDDVAAPPTAPDSDKFEAPLVWRNVILFVLLHSAIPIALWMAANPEKRPHGRTVAWMYLGSYISGIGITGGAHRLWSHKAYKARLPVEVMLMLLQTMAGQNSIYTWCRDHRVHHKFSETNADPHNIKRGFFFAHMGWLCCRKHPEVAQKGATVDMSDLEANPIVMFQHRHFWWLAILFTVLAPTMLPVWFWQERFWTSFVFSFMLRYLFTLHGTWLVNSAAHYDGSRPYDKNMEARESPWVIIFGLGEGFHNYHHTFPYDYSTSEFGKYFNLTTTVIDLLASLGLVYDRRKIDKKTIEQRKFRTGEKKVVEEADTNSDSGVDDYSSILAPVASDEQSKQTSEPGDLEVAGKFVSPFNMDYISGPTSLKYTM